MKNFVQEGEVIPHLLSGNVASGDVVVIGDLVGVAASSGGNGDTISVNLEGVYTLPKASGAGTIAKGAKVYVDASGDITDNADNGASPAVAHVWAGWAWEAVGNSDTEVKVKLKTC